LHTYVQSGTLIAQHTSGTNLLVERGVYKIALFPDRTKQFYARQSPDKIALFESPCGPVLAVVRRPSPTYVWHLASGLDLKQL
jgi:hypothetical protein